MVFLSLLFYCRLTTAKKSCFMLITAFVYSWVLVESFSFKADFIWAEISKMFCFLSLFFFFLPVAAMVDFTMEFYLLQKKEKITDFGNKRFLSLAEMYWLVVLKPIRDTVNQSTCLGIFKLCIIQQFAFLSWLVVVITHSFYKLYLQ